jgi:hypothetical protein
VGVGRAWRARRVFESVVREDRSVVDLLDADYTFLNERLAKHYGVPKARRSPTTSSAPARPRSSFGRCRTAPRTRGDRADAGRR